VAAGFPGLGQRGWRRLGRLGRAGRRVAAAGLTPVLAVSTLALPSAAMTAAVVAGVTAAAVVAAPATPAKAATGLSVLVVKVDGESAAPEAALLTSAGYAVSQDTPAQLEAMSQATFQGFAAVVIGDPSSGGSCPTGWQPTTAALGTNWEGWVDGNVSVLGTAPALAAGVASSGNTAADTLITGTAEYAAAQPSATAAGKVAQTGLYLSLDCGYTTEPKGFAVSVLNGVEGIGPAGGVTVNGSLSCSDSGSVNSWGADAAGTLGGLASASLAAGAPGWPSPACPVQEAFDSWPAMFTPVGYDAASDATANFTASDGVTGQPYILLGSPAAPGTAALAPATDGEVPEGATAAGSNPAAPGVSQPTAGDVNTEDGDFTQSATDVSIPTIGPSFSFSRSYDAQTARQETIAGTPGPMGYGWTDNWATSLTTGTAVPGDIYTGDGKETWDGNGWVPTSQTLDTPAVVAQYGGNTYIADSQSNRVEEIAGSTGTQWGISMTAGHMYTVAGNQYGTQGQSANGTAPASTLLNAPAGVAANASGLYIADTNNCRVVEIAAASGTQWGISMTAGDMYTVAGENASNCGTGADGKAATASDLNDPAGLAFDTAGDLYVADSGNNRVQEVAVATKSGLGTANDVYTAAGSAGGTSGTSSPGGAASSALLAGPEGVSVDGSGNLYIADTGNCRVMEAAAATGTQWGQSMTAHDIYTIAGRNGPTNCGVGDDAKAATASNLNEPSVVWAGNGNLYIADGGNNRVQEVAGTAHTEFGQSMTATYVYTVAGNWNGASGYSGNGGVADSALMDDPEGAWVDSSGDLYIADSDNNVIREVTASSDDISTVAGTGGTPITEGDGGPAEWAGLNNAGDVVADPQGDIFIADSDNNRIQEVAASTHTQFGIAMTAGDVYTVAGSAIGTFGDSGDGGLATSALLDSPEGVGVDSDGNLYIGDTGNNRVQEVSASTGDVSTIAGSATGASGVSGDDGAATSALLAGPMTVAVDASGDIYITDYDNDRIQEIAGVTGTQRGVAMTAGHIYTVAGSASGNGGYSGDDGSATSALLNTPAGIAVDQAGNLYIADQGNDVVREVAGAPHTQWGVKMTTGDIYTVAGNYANGGGTSGDGGPATSAELNTPDSVAVDSAGDLYIADTQNGRIQEVPASSGAQWSQSMVASDIYTVAGSAAGTSGYSGDGGAATAAEMDQPAGMTIDSQGNLFTATGNDLREIASSNGSPFKTSPAGTGITVTQSDGSHVSFYPKNSSGSCTAPYVLPAGSTYCTLLENVAATLTSSGTAYAYSPSPGSTYTYASTGALESESDAAGDSLTFASSPPVPGSGDCPSTASSCQAVTAISGTGVNSGRTLVIGSNTIGLITSVTDPMDRTWTYAYNSADQLTSVTGPMGSVTSYTYGAGSTGNPQLANDLLTVTDPNAQPGGPDAGDATVNLYDSDGRVASQSDPMGLPTSYNYCVNAAADDCMDSATGTGFVTVTDPDGNQTVYDYDQGTLAAASDWTDTTSGQTLTSENDSVPDTTAATTSNPSGGTLLNTSATDGVGITTTSSYDTNGNPTSATSPGDNGTPATTTSAYTATLSLANCDSTATAATTATCQDDAPPAAVAPGGVITPPSSAPPQGVTYTLYDTIGNELYSTTGVYEPGATTAAYSQTTYQLFQSNSVTLNGTTVSCTTTPPSRSLPCAKINADGVVTQLEYDSQGDLVSSSTPDGNGSEVATTTYTDDADGEQTVSTAPDGNVSDANEGNYTTTTAYNADGKKTSVTQAGGSGATVTPRTTSYGYDANGNPTTVKDVRGYTTTTAYNADDKPSLVTNPDGDATLTCYDGDGGVAQTVPAVGVAANNLTAASCPTSYPAGYSDRLAADATVTTYDANGDKTEQTSPAPAGQSGYLTTTYAYNGDGGLTQTSSPPVSDGGPDVIAVDTYNQAGEVASETTGYGTTAASTRSFCYDPNGDITSATYADGNALGTTTCETSSPWIVSATLYPNEAAYQTTYSYNSAGELVSTTSPATTAAPSGATTTSTYDPTGNMLTSTDPNGVTTTYTYTPLGQEASASYSGSAAHSVTYTYDADGDRTGMSDATGTSSYAFDPFGELTTATNGTGQETSYTYDGDGDATGTTYPLPATATWATTDTVTYGYDNAGLLTSATDFNGNKITIGHTADALPNSESLGSSGDKIAASYDSSDDPSSISLGNSSSTLQSFAYSDAPSGSILSESDTPISSQTPSSYTYDSQGQVTSMTLGDGPTADYSFDASGNLTTLPTGATGTYNDAGELTSSALSGSTTNYSYDAYGEELAATQGSSDVSSAAWNGAGDLTSYNDGAASLTAATYDGNGLRESSSSTPSGGSASTEGYVWNIIPSVPQLLMDSTNAYIYTNGAAPAEQVNLSTGAVTYLVTDRLGSVRGTVNSVGALTATTSYGPWGSPETTGGLTATTPFGYSGGYTDPDGLLYLLSRYYSPTVGQFISVDPAIEQTLQPYEYADGDPIALNDPTGLWWAYNTYQPIGRAFRYWYTDYSALMASAVEKADNKALQEKVTKVAAYINLLSAIIGVIASKGSIESIVYFISSLLTVISLSKLFTIFRKYTGKHRKTSYGFYTQIAQTLTGNNYYSDNWRSCASDALKCGSPGHLKP
jgi:trimeric autotransporter adhesin